MKSLYNLNAYNQLRKEKQQTSPSHSQSLRNFKPVFISEHLPKELYEEKKKLMPEFKAAKKANKKND